MVVPSSREYGTRDHQELAGGEPSRSQHEALAWVLGTLFTGGETEEHSSAVTDAVLRGSRFWPTVYTSPPAAWALRTIYLHNHSFPN